MFTLRGPWRIPIQFDVSLLILAVFFGMFFLDRGILPAIAAFLIIIVAILLHELGHAAACVAQGVPVNRVVLFGGGGFCEHDARVTPRQAEFIAVAGPLVNLGLWAIVTLALPLLPTISLEPVLIDGTYIYPPEFHSSLYRMLAQFAQLNLFLALFNLVPVLPLDGGQLLQSWLHRFMNTVAANKIAGGVGVILTILWIPLMFAAFFAFGFVLIFLPNLPLQWRLLRRGHG